MLWISWETPDSDRILQKDEIITTYVVLLTSLPDTQSNVSPNFIELACGCSLLLNSKLVTYFSPQALQWDKKSNQLWFSNHKIAQEIRVAICPSNLARIFVSFSQPTSQLVRHFPRVNHSTEAETLGMKNSQNINISPPDSISWSASCCSVSMRKKTIVRKLFWPRLNHLKLKAPRLGMSYMSFQKRNKNNLYGLFTCPDLNGCICVHSSTMH